MGNAEYRGANVSYNAIAIFDSCSDSSWVSSDLAKHFPQARRKKVTLPLQTLEGSSEFRTYQHQIKINTSQGQRSVKVYESPSIGSVSYPSSFHQKLQKAFNLPFHLPQGEVGILAGMGAPPRPAPPREKRAA